MKNDVRLWSFQCVVCSRSSISLLFSYETSLATRAILFCNSAKATVSDVGTKTGASQKPGAFTQKSGSRFSSSSYGFRPMKKSQWFDIWRRRRERLSVLSSSFRELRDTPANLATVDLPAIKAIGRQLPTQIQNQTMKEVTSFPRGTSFPGASSSSAQLLKDGDIVGDEEEDDERRDVISFPAMDGASKEPEAEMAQYDDDEVEINDDD